ncbi:alpha/beta-type small acid-soluble spore protein [Caloramator sp. E03]|uniref:alpha/beta-type small acid-soluble spore protein n=1 Tax=Caloramator sp. E03 TaxID=2576307 RepID=UPI001110122C|nr:alpha/beta-type small acid-soluble spore protein [Caloramator sp. E03]QCX33549.1 alpha/beta-type small acid-soluble spore protein [Caloramator sp. E03]
MADNKFYGGFAGAAGYGAAAGSKNQSVVPEAKKGLDQFKEEVAAEVGVQVPATGYWGNMTSKECGTVGGYMVKKMVEAYERNLAGK